MREFKDFGIKPTIVGFVGESINIDKVLNKKIVVHKFTIGPSKKKENSKCLTLQSGWVVDLGGNINFFGRIETMKIRVGKTGKYSIWNNNRQLTDVPFSKN